MSILQRKVIAAAALALACFTAAAQTPTDVRISTTGQPTSWEIQGRPMEIAGFLHARFGMTLAEVRGALATDFGNAVAASREETAADGRRTLFVTLAAPADDPLAAQRSVNYVFGATSQRLIAVNASWVADGNPTPQQRASLLALGTAFTAEMVGFQWPMLATARGHVIAPNVVILLAGQDERGAGLEIRLDGVALDVLQPDVNGKPQPPQHQAAPAGPARLRLALVANAEQPEVPTVAPGKF
jgi:hypothetical protein